MSEDVFYKGKLRPTYLTPQTFCFDNGITELPKYTDSWEECIMDKFYQEAIIIDELVYRVEKEEQNPYDSVFEATKNEDGSYDFIVKYYNGGCGFDEAINYAVDKCK